MISIEDIIIGDGSDEETLNVVFSDKLKKTIEFAIYYNKVCQEDLVKDLKELMDGFLYKYNNAIVKDKIRNDIYALLMSKYQVLFEIPDVFIK